MQGRNSNNSSSYRLARGLHRKDAPIIWEIYGRFEQKVIVYSKYRIGSWYASAFGKDLFADVLEKVRDRIEEVGLEAFREEGRFSKTLWTFVKNHLNNEYRKQHRRHHTGKLPLEERPEICEMPALTPSPEDRLVTEMLWETVRGSCSTEQKFEVLELYFREAYSFKEIAEVQGRTLTTVRAEYYRLRVHLAKVLPFLGD